MSYPAGEALILTALRNIAGSVWTSNNSSRGNWKILNSGKSSYYAVLKPGSFVTEFISISQTVTLWRTIIEVWQRYTTDGTSLENIEALSNGIIQRFNALKQLGDTTSTIQDSQCAGGGEIEERWKKGADGPFWLKQNIIIEWKEEANVTFV